MMKSATSLRPLIVQVMAANQGRVLSTEQIYEMVAALGVRGFDPGAKRDRNLVNRELSDLAGCTTQGPQQTFSTGDHAGQLRSLRIPRVRPSHGCGAAAGISGTC